MKNKLLTLLVVIAVILILCSLVLFYDAMFVSHMASYNVHRELQHIYASKQSEESMTLTNDRYKELMQLALQDANRWRLQLGGSAKLQFYSAIVLLILAIIQITLTHYIYRHNIAAPPEPDDTN